MVEIEKSLLPKLSSYMTISKRHVNDTTVYVKQVAIDHALSILNSFHEYISATFEQEINGKISFLDILILRNRNSFKLLYTVNPPITISSYTGNHLHQIHETVAHLEH